MAQTSITFANGSIGGGLADSLLMFDHQTANGMIQRIHGPGMVSALAWLQQGQMDAPGA